jgi:hypothetical protein
MVQTGLSEDVIIKVIAESPTVFRFTPGDLTALGQAKVPEAVFKAMASKQNGEPIPGYASPKTTAPPPLPKEAPATREPGVERQSMPSGSPDNMADRTPQPATLSPQALETPESGTAKIGKPARVKVHSKKFKVPPPPLEMTFKASADQVYAAMAQSAGSTLVYPGDGRERGLYGQFPHCRCRWKYYYQGPILGCMPRDR